MAATTAAETEGAPRDPAALRTPPARDPSAERAAVRADRLQKRASVAQPEAGRLHQRHDPLRRRGRRRLHHTAAHKHDDLLRCCSSQDDVVIVDDDGRHYKRQLGTGLATAATQDVVVATRVRRDHHAASATATRSDVRRPTRRSIGRDLSWPSNARTS